MRARAAGSGRRGPGGGRGGSGRPARGSSADPQLGRPPPRSLARSLALLLFRRARRWADRGAQACVCKSEGVWLGAIFFLLLLLNCGDRKKESLPTVFPGRNRPAGPPLRPSSRPASGSRGGSPFPFPPFCPPHLEPSPARQRVSRVSAKRPGHLSWQLHGNPGASAVWSLCGFLWQNHGDSTPSAKPSSLPLRPPNDAVAKLHRVGAISKEVSTSFCGGTVDLGR